MNRKQPRIGQTIFWYEDMSDAESGPEPPEPCWGPVEAITSGGSPMVRSHYSDDLITLRNWTRVPKAWRSHVMRRDHRKRRRFVGGRQRARS